MAVFFGVIAQRITGMGFALVVAPFLVLLLGPFSGIMILNLCAAVSASIILGRVWRLVDWAMYVRLVIPAVIGIVPGSLLAARLPAAVLELSVGILLFIAIMTSLVISKLNYTVHSPIAPAIAGFTSGVMNTSAGIGGPAISVYAVLTRWDQRTFAATLQPYFATIATVSVITKLIISPGDWPQLEWWVWVGIAVALSLGLLLSELLSSRVSHTAARSAVIIIAFLGSITAIMNGLMGLQTTIP
ncbi:MAG: hypothetical protein JWP30_1179 [Homoserinimonas sp.]|nr:hypothetical protein [Homoserinimonas sp.]